MLLTTKTEATRENQPEEIDYQVVHSSVGRLRIRVPKITIDSEYATKLNFVVESLDFVISVRINPVAGCLIVNYNTDLFSSVTVQADLFSAIQQASFVEVPLGAIPTKTESSPEINWGNILLPLSSLGFALVAEQLLLPIPVLVLGGTIAVAALPFFSRVVDTIVNERRLNTDLLDVLWVSLYTIKGDFVTPALTLSLIESSEALRDTTARAQERQALDLLSSLDKYARVERDGQEQRILLQQVQTGDRVVVYTGELIPVSGRVMRGTALIDEHKLTGESNLVCRYEGQVVHASTLVIQGKLCILAKRIGKNTRVGVAFELMQTAPVHDTRVEDYAAKIADAAIMPILLLSAGIFALTRDATRALALLQLDFCNGIRLSVPTTILAALTGAARKGIYIRSGRALEMLARIDTVIFDKTGTLTQGNAAVVAIRTATEQTDSLEVLALAASAEQGNTHPVAEAILRYAQENSVQTHKCDTWDYRIGMGIVARINDQQILVGSHRLMLQETVDVEPIHRRYPDINSGSKSLVYVARDGELLGVILYTDPLRPESRNVVTHLHQQGIDTYMLTGDRQRVADEVAWELGIHQGHTYAEVFPERKVELVRQLNDDGRTVAFVGEGINDAAALAYADVSVSFGGGSDLARETADIILLDDNLEGLTDAIDIAKQAMETIYQNAAIAIIPNISVVIAGIVFALDPILEVIISNGAVILAELNSVRPLFTPEEEQITDISADNQNPMVPAFNPC